MPDAANHLTFALICLGMVLTPGPNMIYLISRSLSQGPKAGLISLGGVALGFLFYVLSAAFGITALIFAVLSVCIWGCNPKQELLAPQQPTIITPGSVTSATAADYLYAGALSRWKAAMNGGLVWVMKASLGVRSVTWSRSLST